MDRLLEMRNITKRFGGSYALNEAMFDLQKGEIHALVGENGAGKSTLIRILYGDVRADGGTIRLDGSLHQISHPMVAQRLGIFAVQQHFSLIPTMSVAENIFFGDHPCSLPGVVDWGKMKLEARRLLERVGLEDLDLDLLVERTNVSVRQKIEIAKAIHKRPRVLIMDEPTAVLPVGDVKTLFSIMRNIKEEGAGIVYISHHLDEVFEIADRITVLKDGQNVRTLRPSDTDRFGLVRLMVGREIGNLFPQRTARIEDEVLSVTGLSTKTLHDVSFSLRRGEVLGVAGLGGSGRTELCNALFGVDKVTGGTIVIHGKPIAVRRPRDAIAHGLGFVTEDRHRNGLILSSSVRTNILFAGMRRISTLGILRRAKELESARYYVERLRIVASSMEESLQNLSGGNQQKAVLAKWLMTKPALLLLDEPTRGIDVGAKAEIYQIMNELVAAGLAVIMVSSELQELLQMTDRILVMREGRIAGEFLPRQSSEEEIIACASGVAADAKAKPSGAPGAPRVARRKHAGL